jgi:hypothetical protein
VPESTPKPLPPDAPLIPIVLGVVGHRDLHPDSEPWKKVKAELKKVFEEFDRAYPNSPKVLLSPLAPGADQLAADVALEGRNWTVRAPLAFEPAVFLRSTSFQFEGQKTKEDPDGFDRAAQDKFEHLLKQDRVEWFVVPLPPALRQLQVDWKEVAAGGAGKTDQEALRWARYANPGGYIVRHCHTLLALWDGRGATKLSGTAESVRFKLSGKPPTYYPWTVDAPLGFAADRGPVIVIHTPRANDTADTKVGALSVRVPSKIPGEDYGEEVKVARSLPLWERFKAWGRRTCGWKEEKQEVKRARVARSLPRWELIDVIFARNTCEKVSRVARSLSRWERFKARVRQAWGWKEEQQPVSSGTSAGPGPSRPRPPRTDCPEYEQFLSICQAIDDFNREALGVYGTEEDLKKDYRKRLTDVEDETEKGFGATDPDDLKRHKGPLRSWYRRFLRVRETAGYLANDLAPLHDRARNWLFRLLFLALLVFHFYAHPPWHLDHDRPTEHPPALLALFGVVWLAMGGTVVWLWWVRLDERRLDYRALAEALRVRQAYALAGLGQSVADTYLAQVRTELAWVRRALQHLCPPSEFWEEQFQQLGPARKLDRLGRVKEVWVKGQQKQHGRRKDEEHHKAVRCRRLGFGLAILGLILLLSPLAAWTVAPRFSSSPTPHAAGDRDPAKVEGPSKDGSAHKAAGPAAPKHPPTPTAHAEGTNWLDPAHPANVLLLAGSMLVILGGLYIAVCDRRAHEELAKQYDQMHVVFRAGAQELALVLDPKGRTAVRAVVSIQQPTAPASEEETVKWAQRIVEELGREALHENAQWMLVRRSKPLELPLGA